MPVNKSDLEFFELLSQAAENNKISSPSIDELRINIKQLSYFVDLPANIPFEDLTITFPDGHEIRLRYYPNKKSIAPIIIYFPGNGFIYDLFQENHTIISKITQEADCHAVMIECRLAPETPYPAPLEDALEAVKYIFEHCNDFRIDINKIILTGYSSGANLAAVITNQLRKKGISIFHQFLISGAFDYTDSLHDYDHFALQDRMLDPQSAKFSFDCYSHESQRHEPTCSPYWEPDLSNLPPTTIMVGEYDGGRNQSEGYAKKLKDAGNQVEKIILAGQTHGTILFRKACFQGEDPAVVAGKRIKLIVS